MVTDLQQWRVLRLSPRYALLLAKEIEERFLAYAEKEERSAESYLIHFALAPNSVPMMRGLAKGKRLKV